MDPVAWFLKIPPDPRSPNSNTSSPLSLGRTGSSPSSGVGSMLSSLFLRSWSEEGLRRKSSVRPSGPDGKPRQKPARTVSWNPHVEVWRPTARSVTWSAQVEIFIIPARECAVPGNDSVSSAVVPVEDTQPLLAPDAVGHLRKGADVSLGPDRVSADLDQSPSKFDGHGQSLSNWPSPLNSNFDGLGQNASKLARTSMRCSGSEQCARAVPEWPGLHSAF